MRNYAPKAKASSEHSNLCKSFPHMNAIPTEVKVVVYDAKKLTYHTLDDLLRGVIEPSADKVLWVEVVGLADTDQVKAICQHFNFHSLAVEDTLTLHQRPKVDDYDHYQFIVSELITVEQGKNIQQQVSIFLGQHYLVSFSERPSSLNLTLEKNLQGQATQLRSKGVDYLLYEIVDFVTDSYFPVMATYSDKLDVFQNLVLTTPESSILRQVQVFKHDLRQLRQVVWTNRDMLSVLLRNELGLITAPTLMFMRDCYDHAVRQIDILESQRDNASSLVDLYLSSTANRLGEIMKVLTVISIVFMPPTFLAGVWGMNFKNIPELSWHYGYFFAWICLLLSSIVPTYLFWHMGWLRRER